MNRREFVKALVGIPLLGLLVKVPKEPPAIGACQTQASQEDYSGFMIGRQAGLMERPLAYKLSELISPLHRE